MNSSGALHSVAYAQTHYSKRRNDLRTKEQRVTTTPSKQVILILFQIICETHLKKGCINKFLEIWKPWKPAFALCFADPFFFWNGSRLTHTEDSDTLALVNIDAHKKRQLELTIKFNSTHINKICITTIIIIITFRKIFYIVYFR